MILSYEEVENALTRHAEELQRCESIQSEVANNQQALNLSISLYEQGLINYLEVLDVQRQLLSSEQKLVESQLNIVTSAIAIYKGVGGGVRDI